ncbi:unnamed protein product [Urochloa humidicola]
MEAAGDEAVAARAGTAGNGVPSQPQQGAKRAHGGGVRGTEAELAAAAAWGAPPALPLPQQVPAGAGSWIYRAREWGQGAKDLRSHAVSPGSATSTRCDLATP